MSFPIHRLRLISTAPLRQAPIQVYWASRDVTRCLSGGNERAAEGFGVTWHQTGRAS